MIMLTHSQLSAWFTRPFQGCSYWLSTCPGRRKSPMDCRNQKL